jgi:putative phage-type endonuclease
MTEVARPIDPVKAQSYDRLIHSDDREKWLELRTEGVGASDSATIMGMNPHESAYTLFQERTGAILRQANEDNRYMQWGRRLEPLIAAAYEEDTGRQVFRNGWLCRSKAHPWLLATPDYDQVDCEHGPGLLEIKNTGANQAHEWDEHIPPKHQCQLQHQLLVVGVTWGSVACLIGGNDDRYGNIAAHPRFQRALARSTERFLKMVRGELPPPEPDAHPSTSQTLMKLIESGHVVQLPDVALHWHREEVKYARQERDAHDRREEYRDLLRAAVGRASYGALPGNAGVYKFVTVNQPEKLIPASSKRQLKHVKKLPKEKKP